VRLVLGIEQRLVVGLRIVARLFLEVELRFIFVKCAQRGLLATGGVGDLA
jgi:hypothetical protein